MRRAEALPPAGEVVGTARAARWLGLGERRVRQLCEAGRLPGAYQFAPGSKWLIPAETLDNIRARATSDNAAQDEEKAQTARVEAWKN